MKMDDKILDYFRIDRFVPIFLREDNQTKGRMLCSIDVSKDLMLG